MISCPKCGNALGAATAVCRLCGHIVGGASVPRGTVGGASVPRDVPQLRAWCQANLSREDRAMLMLRWADGRSDDDIAEVLDLGTSFVTEALRGIEERITEISQEVADV